MLKAAQIESIKIYQIVASYTEIDAKSPSTGGLHSILKHLEIESILVHLNLNLTTPVGLLVPTTLTTPAGGNRLLAGNDDPPSSTHIPITTPTHIPKKEKGRHPMTKGGKKKVAPPPPPCDLCNVLGHPANKCPTLPKLQY